MEQPKFTAKEFKTMLAAEVTPEVYNDTLRIASQILDGIPRHYALGTTTAALMLAAVAFAESAPFARALIQEPIR